VAKEVIGIQPGFKHFGTMHILNSKKGTYFLADTLINRHPDTETLIDIAKLSDKTVRFFNHTPVISMLSYSNFGADTAGSPVKVHEAVAHMQEEYPELAIDGEMQVNFAMNRELRDIKYPFTRLKGKDVNTLIFPNLSSANAGYSCDIDNVADRAFEIGEMNRFVQSHLDRADEFRIRVHCLQQFVTGVC
jgi:malate dehydrogenase (oxaloacetate-decarboxylating)(NADP+)